MRRRPREVGDIRSLDMIATAVRRGEALTRQLLAFARRRALFPEPIDLAAALADMRGLLEHSLRSDITLTLEAEGPAEDHVIRVDASELELAVLNIAVNARDAMPSGGRVSMHLRRIEIAAADHPDGRAGSFVALTVSDTGSGIAPDLLPRVFDPFFTTKEVGRGTGLGLSQVYGFARQSGGTATIASTPDEGTTVTLTLPHSTEHPVLPSEPVSSDAQPGAGLHALLVEDNHDVAAVTRARLQTLGFDVTVAASARAALALLELQRFALVLTDVLMPGGMSGIELLCYLREQGNDVPVVIATGDGTASEQARRDGCLVLQKPYDETRLREIIVHALMQGSPAPVNGT
jgi:two-component system NtrC family sensor kinase